MKKCSKQWSGTARSATPRAPRQSSPSRSRSTTSSPKSPRPASPREAQQEPTTSSVKPRWKTANARVISDAAAVEGEDCGAFGGDLGGGWGPPEQSGGGRSPEKAPQPEPPPCRGQRLMELLRFATAGSVDDGKSTLIGRLLYDSKQIFEDTLEALEHSTKLRGEEDMNLALLTDGLRAEREQGITIDVAYRYFATPSRKFIIADTPGHVQYTRNMITGASTADLALILVDARKGILEQSRRHAFLASLLGVPHLVLCINKMDLVDYDQTVYERIKNEFKDFAAKLDVHDLQFIPVSALKGDNVVERSANTPWYEG